MPRVAKGDGKTNLAAFIPQSNLCEACRAVRRCWERRQDNAPETFEVCPTDRGKVRVSSKHGRNEKRENVRIATYLANKHGYEIDLIANPDNESSADSFNKTLGIIQEYKTNATPTKSAIDNLIRKGAKQARDLVLFVESSISMDDLSSALHNRVSRTKIHTVMVVIDGKDKTYSFAEIAEKGFKIRQADLE